MAVPTWAVNTYLNGINRNPSLGCGSICSCSLIIESDNKVCVSLASLGFRKTGNKGTVWRRKSSVTRAALVEATRQDLPPLKAELLSVVAGLDRGLLAKEENVKAADEAAQKLESAGDAVQFPEDLDKLQGRWRLVYSSAFASGNLGGSRPGPSTNRFPLSLGQVYQDIDVVSKEFDNVVDLRIATPWPLPPLEVNARLAHTFETKGISSIKIIFEKTTVKAAGALSSLSLPPLDLPRLPDFLRQSSGRTGFGEFEVTYMDSNFRITRGDRGELRVFVRS